MAEFFTDQDWNVGTERYTLEQLRAAVPEAIRSWADGVAEKAGRNLAKADLRLHYREPDGTINVNGVAVALAAISGTQSGALDIPLDVRTAAMAELESALLRFKERQAGLGDGDEIRRQGMRIPIAGPGISSDRGGPGGRGTSEGKTMKPSSNGRELVEIRSGVDLATGRVDKDAAIIHGIKLIGLTSANTDFGRPRRYTTEALQNALPLYEGCPFNIDHPRNADGDFEPGKVRAPTDRAGVFFDAKMDPEGGVRASLRLLKSHPMTDRLLEAASDPEMSRLFQMSHNAVGYGKLHDGEFVIEEIERVRGVDCVTEGATTRGLFEGTKINAGEGPIGDKVAKQAREERLRQINSVAMDMVHEIMWPHDDADELTTEAKRTRLDAILDDWQTELGKDTNSDAGESVLSSGASGLPADTGREPDKGGISMDATSIAQLKATNPGLVEAMYRDWEEQANVKKMLDENKVLRTKVEAFETAGKLADRRKIAERLCREANLPASAITDPFLETLIECEDDARRTVLVEDRRRLAFGRPRLSGEQDYSEGTQMGDAVAVDHEAAVKATDSLVGVGG